MPLLNRGTRRLLRLLILGRKKRKGLDWFFELLPLLIWISFFVYFGYFYEWGEGESKSWLWGVGVYIYAEMNLRRMEKESKITNDRVGKLTRNVYYLERRIGSMVGRDGRVRVDVNDLFAEGERWKHNQACHQAQQRARYRGR